MGKNCSKGLNNSLGREKKLYINCPGHMTKMAAMPIYGKNLQISSAIELNRPMILKLSNWSIMYSSFTMYMYI